MSRSEMATVGPQDTFGDSGHESENRITSALKALAEGAGNMCPKSYLRLSLELKVSCEKIFSLLRNAALGCAK